MKKAGFYHLGFGVEAGSDESLKKIKKSLTMSEIKDKVTMVKKHGIGTTGFFIIGFPFETEADIIRTGKTPDILGLDLASFGNFTPLPGTEIYHQLVESGEIPDNYLPAFASGKATYAPEGLTIEKLEKLHKKIIFNYYLSPQRIAFIIKRLHFSDFKYVIRRLYQIIFRPDIAE